MKLGVHLKIKLVWFVRSSKKCSKILFHGIVVVAGLSLEKDVVSVTHDTAPVMNSLGRSLFEVANRDIEGSIPVENVGAFVTFLM
jgi:hypothetical protein